ncbi:MAG: class I SAM-dependent methyltransferase [Candidatus Shapirobacteria bacterium]
MSKSIDPLYLSTHSSRFDFLFSQIDQLNLPPTAKVLDIGCYPPVVFNHLKKKFQVWGLASPHEPLNHPQVLVANLETDPLPFSNSTFDLIIFSEVLEHLYRQIPSILIKLNKLLIPGGYLIITSPNAVSLFTLAKVIIGRNPTYPISDLSKDDPVLGTIYHRHNREYTANELKQLLISAGFKIRSQIFFSAYTPIRPHMAKKSLSHRLLSWFLYILSYIFPSRRDSLFFLVTN